MLTHPPVTVSVALVLPSVAVYGTRRDPTSATQAGQSVVYHLTSSASQYPIAHDDTDRCLLPPNDGQGFLMYGWVLDGTRRRWIYGHGAESRHENEDILCRDAH